MKSKIIEQIEINGEQWNIVESRQRYSIPEIAKKLAANKPLDEIERQMAAGVIFDWLARKKAQIENGKKHGRVKKFASDKERYAFHNARRREKKLESK